MTALAGLWRFDGRPDAADCCARMLAAQEVYGPHSSAQWSDTAVALGRRLMKVLPEDSFDRQPLIGGGGRYVLVADVRLDNRDELAEALRIPGPKARTLCDAAVLLAALERWDESCLEHLVGDYAFVAWDRPHRRMLLARDPLGLRPLLYHRGQKFFAFASMPKGLHALPDVPVAPDEERIAEFLIKLPDIGSRSFFVGVERVEPGHVVSVTASSLAARRHWVIGRRRIVLPRPEEYVELARDLLDRAVSCRLRGSGDVGAHLTGGLDSGAVVATAARLLAPSGRRVIAFTAVPRAGYDGTATSNAIVDEAGGAAATAALYPNVEHVIVRNKGRSPLADLDRLFFLLDAPARNLSGTGSWDSLYEAIQQRKVPVVLTGSVGNLGLSYDGGELLPELFRSRRWLQLWSEASALVAARQMRWRGVLAGTFGPWCPPSLWVSILKWAKGRNVELGHYTAINPRRLDELGLKARAKARNYDLAFRPAKDGFEMRLHLLQSADPGNSCKAGLANTRVDVRHPLADVRLLEFCLAVPMEQFVRDGIPRALARSVLADRLPKQVLEPTTRPVLQGVDWHVDLIAARESITQELARFEACPAAATALDLPRLRRLTENWPASGWEREEVELPYRYALLDGIAVGHFLRRATGSNY